MYYSKDVYAIDHKTGQPLFKPKLPTSPLTPSKYNNNNNITKQQQQQQYYPRDMYIELLQKDEKRKEKIRLAKENAEVRNDVEY